MQEDELLAVRVKDGIFVGNVVAAMDREFLSMNKITHVINCAGGEVPNFFAGDVDLKYLFFPWKDSIGSICTTVLFDPADDNVRKSMHFIDEALEDGNCVLVHSVQGMSRSAALIAAYFIVKYKWKLESALAFLRMAHPDTAIKPQFMRQLRLFAACHPVEHDIFDTNVSDNELSLDNAQLMLRNTLLNGLTSQEQRSNKLFVHCSARVDTGDVVSARDHKLPIRISFVDTQNNTGTTAAARSLVVATDENSDGLDGADGESARLMGARGLSALHAATPRTASILSRRIPPCSRPLVSEDAARDACVTAQKIETVVLPSSAHGEANGQRNDGSAAGKQAWHAVPSQDVPVLQRMSGSPHATALVGFASSVPASVSATAAPPEAHSQRGDSDASSSATPKNALQRLDFARLAPPAPRSSSPRASAARSPFSTLSTKHKHRVGSPLPMAKDKAVLVGNTRRTRVSSLPSSRSGDAATLHANSSVRTSSQRRTGSPRGDAAATYAGTTDGAAVVRASSSAYRGIAPSRSTAAVAADRAGDAPHAAVVAPVLRASTLDALAGREARVGRRSSPRESSVSTQASTASNRRRDVVRTGSPRERLRPVLRSSSLDARGGALATTGTAGPATRGLQRYATRRTLSAQRQVHVVNAWQ